MKKSSTQRLWKKKIGPFITKYCCKYTNFVLHCVTFNFLYCDNCIHYQFKIMNSNRLKYIKVALIISSYSNE